MDVSLIRATLAKKQLLKQDLARHLGVSANTVGALLAGERRIQIDELPKIVAFLGLDLVDIVGSVTEGGKISRLEPPLRKVRLPFLPPGDMAAVRIAGSHLLPRYDDGDVIVYWLAQRRPLESFWGREAVVHAKDQPEPLLKHLSPIPGHPGWARLQSSFSSHYLDAQVTWVGEIAGQIRADQLSPTADEAVLSAIPTAVPSPEPQRNNS